ncbi:MAG TPA: glycosyltransferase family A protein, partial [Actinotalea caeni]|uniref:glycosyltransferase family A protein n=1 Tax=Actinotalea caeni TaxID=1348467 RepID=UPI002B4B1E1B
MTERVGVDVVVAVHDTSRPIARAVRSVLDHNGEGVRLTVVCHELDADDVAAVLDPAHRDRVRLLEHRDGRRSPAGPFNAGIDAATADYVGVMGSDDTLAPGAISSWYWLAEKHRADAVVARLEHADGRVVPTPPTRPFRRGLLDGVRDRLSYRSAPLGLVSRAAISRLGLRMDPEVPVGEDVGFVTRLWFGGRVVLDRTGPPYRIGDDATDRVTLATRPVAEELAFVRRLLERPWFRALGLDERRAVCVKLVRIHLFGIVLNRPDPAWWTEAERVALAATGRALLAAAPGVEAVLSLADRALLDRILDGAGDGATLLSLARARRRHGTPRTL